MIITLDDNREIILYQKPTSSESPWIKKQEIILELEDSMGNDVMFINANSPNYPRSSLLVLCSRANSYLLVFHYDEESEKFHTVEPFNVKLNIVSFYSSLGDNELKITCFHSSCINEFTYSYHFDNLFSSDEILSSQNDVSEPPKETLSIPPPNIQNDIIQESVNNDTASSSIDNNVLEEKESNNTLVKEEEGEEKRSQIEENKEFNNEKKEEIVVPEVKKEEEQQKQPVINIDESNTSKIEEKQQEPIIEVKNESENIEEEKISKTIDNDKKNNQTVPILDKETVEKVSSLNVEVDSSKKKQTPRKKSTPAVTPSETPKKSKNRKTKTPSKGNSGKEQITILSRPTKWDFSGEDGEILSKIDELLSISTERMLNRLDKEREKREKEYTKTITKQLEKACQAEIQNSFGKIFNEKVQNVVTESIRKAVSSDIQNCLRDPFSAELQNLFESSLAPTIQKSCQDMFIDVDRSFQSCISNHAQTLSVTNNVSQLTEAVSSLTNVCNSMVGTIAQLATLKNSLSENQVKGNSKEPPTTNEIIDNLIDDKNYSKAISTAVDAKDLSILSRTLSKINNPSNWLSQPGLNQGLLLSLLQQIGADLSRDIEVKLLWLKHCIIALQPNQPQIQQHCSQVLSGIYQNLERVRNQYQNSPIGMEIQFLIPFIRQNISIPRG